MPAGETAEAYDTAADAVDNVEFAVNGNPGRPIDQIINMVAFDVQNPQSVIYEWKVNDQIWGRTGPSFGTERPDGSNTLRVSCRACHGDEVSAWSNTVTATATSVDISGEIIVIAP